jgi:hypothetical protein
VQQGITFDDFSHNIMDYWVTPTKSSKVEDIDIAYKILGKGRWRMDITQNRFWSHNGNVGSNSTIVKPYSDHIRQ